MYELRVIHFPGCFLGNGLRLMCAIGFEMLDFPTFAYIVDTKKDFSTVSDLSASLSDILIEPSVWYIIFFTLFSRIRAPTDIEDVWCNLILNNFLRSPLVCKFTRWIDLKLYVYTRSKFVVLIKKYFFECFISQYWMHSKSKVFNVSQFSHIINTVQH